MILAVLLTGLAFIIFTWKKGYSALPDHLNSASEIEAAFPDDDENGKLVRWLKKKTKHWFAYGPRANIWLARWREFPIYLFAIRGEGEWRWELSDGSSDTYFGNSFLTMLKKRLWESRNILSPNKYYLSRIQRWSRWHLAIQWPFLITFHFYFKASDVPRYRLNFNTDGKQFFFYFGAHRDADKVYWFPSAYIGLNWK